MSIRNSPIANWKGKVMEYDIFKEIKARLSIPDLVQGYGIEINRRGYCYAPFMPKKLPACTLWKKVIIALAAARRRSC